MVVLWRSKPRGVMGMSTDRANDLRAFRDFANEQLTNGGANMTLEEALTLWGYRNSSEEERKDTLQAIREGLEDMHAGRTRPAEEVFAELRRNHGFGKR